jgi:putative membrane protein
VRGTPPPSPHDERTGKGLGLAADAPWARRLTFDRFHIFSESLTKISTSLSIFLAGGALAWAGSVWADVPHADREFMDKAAEAGHTEIDASKRAQTKASSADVKSFASTLISDHTRVGDELDQLTASKHVKVPSGPSVVQRAKIKLLSACSDTSFDKRYADEVGVTAQRDTVALFQKEAADGSDPDVKSFAEKTLPGLNHHLAMATTLQASTKVEK